MSRPTSSHPSVPTSAGMVKFDRRVEPVRRVPLALARRFFQICTSAAAETLSAEDLTPLEFAVMAYVNKDVGEPGIDQISLAARLGIDRNTTSLLVERLEKKAIVERRVNGADRRARLLFLTASGERLHRRLYPIALAGQMRILNVLRAAERELLLDLMVRVIEGNKEMARPGAGRRKRASRQAEPHQPSGG